MITTVIRLTNASSTISSENEFVSYLMETLGSELHKELVYFNSDAQLDGYLTPLFKDKWDNDSKTWTTWMYHTSMENSKDYQIAFLNSKKMRQIEETLANNGWEMSIKTESPTGEMAGVMSIDLNHESNLELIRPERRP